MMVFMAGCAMKDDVVAPAEQAGRVLELRLGMESGTRANPTPGDDGDGRLPGTVNESTVNDVNIFIYNNSGGLSAAASSVITKQLYATSSDFLDVKYVNSTKVERTFTIKIAAADYKPVEGDHILVLANYGSKYPITLNTTTIGELANTIFSRTWSGDGLTDPYNCTHFLMATARSDANDGKVDLSKMASSSNPNVIGVETYVERMSSRIDWMYNATANTPAEGESAGLVYLVEDHQGKALSNGNKVYLEKITPVNAVMPTAEQSNSQDRGVYMLKHLTDATDFTNLKWCVGETGASTSTVPTRYVVEPRTTTKASLSGDALTQKLGAWFGDSRAGALTVNSFSGSGAIDVSARRTAAGSGNTTTETNYNYDRFLVLSYCHENTQAMTLHNSSFITGLAMQCVYRPAKVYSDYDATTNTLTEDKDYTTGGDLWRFSPTDRTVDEAQSLYFSNEAALNKYVEAYKASSATPYVTEDFPGAHCYYNVWLRHANTDEYGDSGWGLGENDPHETFPMEYGIVRNNIYRIGVSFTGPGTPDLELREPRNARFRIFVRKWNLRQFNTVDIPLGR